MDWINALKAGKGYDYYENYASFPTLERLEVPSRIELVLNGAIPLEVQAVDTLGNPIPNLLIAPWTIKKTGKLSYANVGGALIRESNAEGRARFDWLPQDLDRAVTMLPYHEDYHCPQPPSLQLGEETDKLTLTLLRNAIVRGTVTYPDGTPAAGIRLQGEGRGATNFYFRGYTVTDEMGQYELKIYPNQEGHLLRE